MKYKAAESPAIFRGSLFPAILLLACLILAPRAWTADRQLLRGNLPTGIEKLAPIGHCDPAQRMSLSIGLPLRNQAGLTAMLRDVYNPASPNFHHFLTPTQFTEKFGPTAEDYKALNDFANANGLKITATHPNRVILDVEGAAADIEKAFHVTMRAYQHPTEPRTFYAPDSEPSLDLAVPVLHISGLHNYSLPHPNVKVRPARIKPTPHAGSAPDGGYAGGDFRAAYVPGTTLTGKGQSIGLLQFDGYYASDISAYETQFGLPAVPLVNVPINGGVGTPGSGNTEVCLDIEMSIAMAPGISTIYVYEAPQTATFASILSRMANDNLSRQLSCSWGGGPPDPASEVIFQQMAAQGQTFFNASGDSDAFTGEIPFPSDSPNITNVGATTLTTSGPGGTYVSEKVWNWGLVSGNYVGSCGGISTYYSIPSWQKPVSMATNQGSTTKRNTPDVALVGDNVYVCDNNGQKDNVGGTSCAAPLWAGFTALVNQQAATNGDPSPGFLNPTLYKTGLGASYTSAFHDTTAGNNFSATSPTKFSAVAGYDLCTGWGTPNGAALIKILSFAPAPVVTTNPATQILITSATLNGSVNPNDKKTVVTFNYGTTTAYGNTVTAKQSPLAAGSTTTTAVSAALAGLAKGTTYHYQVAAVNSEGTTSTGADQTFVTGTDSELSTLTLSAGTLVPSFVSATTSYSVGESYSVSSVTVTPTLSNPAATVTVNGIAVTSGTASAPIPLAVGTTTITVVVTAPGGATKTKYTITLSRDSQYAWTTFAGHPGVAGASDGTGSAAHFYFPSSSAMDDYGNLYVADCGNNTIRMITPDGVVTTLAGRAGVYGSADGTGSGALFDGPCGVAVDGNGNVYVADTNNFTIRMITPDGVVTTLAGSAGLYGSADGTGDAAEFYYPTGIAVDGNGNVYVADQENHTIRMITTPDGVVTTLAGTAGQPGSTDGAGAGAAFDYPTGVTVDANGNVFVADANNHTIRMVTTPDGVVTTLAGTAGQPGSTDGAGGAAAFYYPTGVTVDGDDNVYVADSGNNTVRKVTSGGVVTTLGGTAGVLGDTDDVGVYAQFDTPFGLVVDDFGDVYMTDLANNRFVLGTPLSVGETPAIVALSPVTGLGGTTATLNGTVNANYGTDTSAEFQYGLTTGYGSTAAVALAPNDETDTQTVSATLTGLAPGTTYHYLLSAINTDGKAVTGDATFTTLSANSSLSALVLSAGTLSPAFASGTVNYAATLPAGTTSVTVTPTTSDSTATLTVNGTAVVSGSASAAIPIASGTNTITIVVTAQNATTTTYTVSVTASSVTTSSFAVWRASVFTSSAVLASPEISGILATPANDGITNLMKYALDLDPLAPGTSGLPTTALQDGYLTLTYRQSKTASDVTYTVLATDSLTGNNWAPAATVLSQTDAGSYWLVTVRDNLPMTGSRQRYMRLQVTTTQASQ